MAADAAGRLRLIPAVNIEIVGWFLCMGRAQEKDGYAAMP